MVGCSLRSTGSVVWPVKGLSCWTAVKKKAPDWPVDLHSVGWNKFPVKVVWVQTAWEVRTERSQPRWFRCLVRIRPGCLLLGVFHTFSGWLEVDPKHSGEIIDLNQSWNNFGILKGRRKLLLGRRMSGLLCLNSCHCNPTSDKWMKIHGWINGWMKNIQPWEQEQCKHVGGKKRVNAGESWTLENNDHKLLEVKMWGHWKQTWHKESVRQRWFWFHFLFISLWSESSKGDNTVKMPPFVTFLIHFVNNDTANGGNTAQYCGVLKVRLLPWVTY